MILSLCFESMMQLDVYIKSNEGTHVGYLSYNREVMYTLWHWLTVFRIVCTQTYNTQVQRIHGEIFFVSSTSELSVVLFLKEGKTWERVLEEVLLNLLHMAKRVIK